MKIDTTRNIILCGFMGCGKTTLGKLLARQLQMDFVDMDEFIVQQEGMGIPAIFETQGEAGFREAEHRAVLALSQRSGTVIATGGGCLTFPRNVKVLRGCGTVLFLNPGFASCYGHIKNSDRPLAKNKTERQLQLLYEFRQALYRNACHREVTAAEDLELRLREMLLALGEQEPVQGTLRDYEEGDKDAVTALWLRSTKMGHPFIPESHWEAHIDRLEEEYLPQAKTRVLLDQEAKITGFLSVLNDNFIGALFVDPDSKARGAGSLLLDDAKERYNKLDLAVYRENGQAVAFYKKHRFRVFGQVVDEETQLPQLMMHWERFHENQKPGEEAVEAETDATQSETT